MWLLIPVIYPISCLEISPNEAESNEIHVLSCLFEICFNEADSNKILI